MSKVPVAYPEKGHPLHLRNNDEKDCKFIKYLSSDPLQAYDIVRAYEFGGHFSPAYKAYLTINKVLGAEMLLEIDSDRAVYRLKES